MDSSTGAGRVPIFKFHFRLKKKVLKSQTEKVSKMLLGLMVLSREDLIPKEQQRATPLS